MQRPSNACGLVPITLVVIALLLNLNFRNLIDAAIVLFIVPFSLIGNFCPVYWLGYDCPRP